MKFWRKSLAIGMAVCLTHLFLGDMALSLETEAVPNAALTRQVVDLLGIGAKVKVELVTGKKLRGSISGIRTDAFLLTSKSNGPPTRVAYEQVVQVKGSKLTYKAAGQPDATAAKRVVAGLGIGRHIVVKTVAGKEYHGKVQGIAANHFTVLPDHMAVPVQLTYIDVVQLGPNLSKGAKIAIIVVVGIVGAYLIWFAAAGPR